MPFALPGNTRFQRTRKNPIQQIPEKYKIVKRLQKNIIFLTTYVDYRPRFFEFDTLPYLSGCRV